MTAVTESLNSKELFFWNRYLGTIDDELENPNVEASIAGNNKIADELLHLFLIGKKRAASGLVRDYKICGEELPKVGDFWIILDSQKHLDV